MDAAKANLAPNHPGSAWLKDESNKEEITIEHEPGSPSVTIRITKKHGGDQQQQQPQQHTNTSSSITGSDESNSSSNSTADCVHVFVDNANRFPVSDFAGQQYGDNLPDEPAILTGCCQHWRAFAEQPPDSCWNIDNLVKRLRPDTKLSLDGGPCFARMSLNSSKVSMSDYQRYCDDGNDVTDDTTTSTKPSGGGGTAKNDSAPLYLFDPDVLASHFANGAPVSDDFIIPECFAHDSMAGLTGTRFRPLPPAWLLVGVARSGTPMHDHPLFVAWNALLVGCKLWCCLPPHVDESVLQFGVADNKDGTSTDEDDEQEEEYDDDFEFDVSALQWFANCATLPDEAKIMIQQPGEVAYVPPSWWHVVLNVETSTAICYSLTLRRDVPRLLPLLSESDEDFARCWRECMESSTLDMENVHVSRLLRSAHL
jgi:hypothetical protein